MRRLYVYTPDASKFSSCYAFNDAGEGQGVNLTSGAWMDLTSQVGFVNSTSALANDPAHLDQSFAGQTSGTGAGASLYVVAEMCSSIDTIPEGLTLPALNGDGSQIVNLDPSHLGDRERRHPPLSGQRRERRQAEHAGIQWEHFSVGLRSK